MPNYENLCNTKKLSLRKLIGSVHMKKKSFVIEIDFNQKKLQKM